MSEHVSTFTLERYLVEDLPGSEHEQVRTHLTACAACQAHLTELAAFCESELQALPPQHFMSGLQARRASAERLGAVKTRKTRLFAAIALGAVAAAAGLVWFNITREPPSTRVAQGERVDHLVLRGTGVQVYRKRAEVVEKLGAHAGIRAGDVLRVVVTLANEASVQVWFLDKQGRVDQPFNAQPQLLAAGENELAGSAEVESPCVDTWLIVGTGEAAQNSTGKALREWGKRAREFNPARLPQGTFAVALNCE